MKARRCHIITAGSLMMVSFLAVTIGFSAYVTAAIYQKGGDINTIGGEVSLRSYFQKGSGTSEDPFVISRPIHFYNFCRLQNLGVFSQNRYFVLGFDPNHPDDTYGQNPDTNLTFYKNNNSNELVTNHTLDMTSIYNDFGLDSIPSIGNEGAPFYGNFDGQGLAVKNLKMSSMPEDVGVFGYTYPGSSVHDVFFINPTVIDDGYETSATIAPMYSDPDFLDLSNLFVWNNNQSVHENGSEPLTSTSTGSNEVVNFADINPRINATATIPTFNNQYQGVTYEWRSSSPLLSIPDTDSNQISNFPFNSFMLDESDDRFVQDYSPFVHSESGSSFHIRLSLIAKSTTDEGLHYSKVLLTYLAVIRRNINSLGDVTYSYQLVKDHVSDEENGYSQYAHGANIGLLCGHAEGGFMNCYVFGGKISLNNQRSGIAPIAQESEMGLIGELGTSSNTSILPIQDFQADNDTGVLNFSKIYEDVAGGIHNSISGVDFYSYVPGEHIETFTGNGADKEFSLNYIPSAIESISINGVETTAYQRYGSLLTFDVAPSYGKVIEVRYSSDSAEKYDEYLLNNQLDGEYKFYATKNGNTVDFVGKKVIQDTSTDQRRGLGVFSLNTSPVDSSRTDNYFNRMGEFAIARDNTQEKTHTYTDFYYTTAEFNADMDGDGVPTYEDVYGWHGSYATRVNTNQYKNLKEYHINQPYKFPNNVSPTTWNPYFERYFNYNIHCSFTGDSSANNYFFNTDSEFLQNYFTYKLVNSAGYAPSVNSPTFGVFVRDVNAETGAEKPITSFDSVLAVTEDSTNSFQSFNSEETEVFSGNGVLMDFDLKHVPLSINRVAIDGTTTNNYSVLDGRISFNSAPANGSSIVVEYTQKNPAQCVVFSIKNDNGANITIFASSTSETGDYVGIYKTNRPDLFSDSSANVTSKPDYAMYLPYYEGADTANNPCFHSFEYDYSTGVTTATAADDITPSNRLYAHTFFLPKGEYIVASPQGTAQLVYLCAQGQNGRGNTGLGKPTGVNSIEDIDFIATNDDPKTLTKKATGEVLDSASINVRCYFAFYSAWDNSAATSSGANDLVISTSLSGGRPTIDITSGSNLTYFLGNNTQLNSCSFNGTSYNKQFYEYIRP